jgi:thymidylate synthase ThyX
MSQTSAKFRKIDQSDRQATFAVEATDGTSTTQVAYGDGVVLPYRSFVSETAFALARPYLVSPESTVTALDMKKLHGVAGAMLARQSRIQGTVVDVLMNEFLITTPEESLALNAPVGELKTQKLSEIIERILIQYGDDSVQELEWATVLFNSVSNLATKVIEDRRLGGFIEQSSRYVYYTERDPVTGRWWYLRETAIMKSPQAGSYVILMDKAFDLYSRLVDSLTEYYQQIKPVETAEYAIRPGDTAKLKLVDLTDEKEIKEFKRVYKFDLKTKACDVARVVLPASTLTNVAMVANGRTLEHLLKRLYSSGSSEFHDIAERLHGTLNKIIPKYVKRADPTGEKYIMGVDDRTRAQIAREFPQFLQFEKSTAEVTWEELPDIIADNVEPIAHTLAATYFPFTRATYRSMVSTLVAQPKAKLVELLKEIVGMRATRRDRGGRGLELGYPITFEITGNFGIFRDLHRHRIMTQQRQLLNPHLGFTVPADVEAIGLGDEVRSLIGEIGVLYDQLVVSVGPEVAQYCVTFGHHIRFTMGFNLRQAQHFLEIRTVPQGHPDYRRVCQTMEKIITAKAPWLKEAGLLGFVDHNDYPWSRADAEARQSQKRIEKGLTDEAN